ncbi:MAG: hypothetical protein ACFCAD_26690 [Pleurocapsa sp.]
MNNLHYIFCSRMADFGNSENAIAELLALTFQNNYKYLTINYVINEELFSTA